jgi:ubiquitin-like-conjugating enzyme ATG3
MTMEAFPHSGAQLASVHPCKHASVMKKFIDRMESAQAQGEVPTPPGTGTSSDKGGKKKWGLGGMVRRVTGGPGSAGEKEKEAKKESSDSSAEESQGLQVDFYLVIVSYHSP